MTGSRGTAAKARPVALFVMGVQRSGTSALTRVLTLCGGALPPRLVGADTANPRGYWESREVIELDEAILRRHGSNWADPTLRLQEEGAFGTEAEVACIAEIREFFTTLPAAPLVVIKDPRITVLSGMWFEATRLAGYDIVVVIAVRHPQEVSASLAAHGGVSAELSSALWLKYNLLAERASRDLPRVFVNYANLLDDWRREIRRISAALAIDLNVRDEGAVDAFLKDDLRRQRHHGRVTDLFGTDWISSTYEALCAAARDEPLDEPRLDRVFQGYQAGERDFRAVLDDFRNLPTRESLRPPILRVMGEIRTIANRVVGLGPRLAGGC